MNNPAKFRFALLVFAILIFLSQFSLADRLYTDSQCGDTDYRFEQPGTYILINNCLKAEFAEDLGKIKITDIKTSDESLLAPYSIVEMNDNGTPDNFSDDIETGNVFYF